MFDDIGGRKFIFIILVTAVATTLIGLRLISAENWVNVVQFITITFFGANTGEKWIDKTIKK